MKWLYVFSRFELSIPDRNRHAPDRLIPFPISRNTDFVFSSGFSVPVSVPDQKKQLRERLRGFPDRSRPFSSLGLRVPTQGGFEQRRRGRAGDEFSAGGRGFGGARERIWERRTREGKPR